MEYPIDIHVQINGPHIDVQIAASFSRFMENKQGFDDIQRYMYKYIKAKHYGLPTHMIDPHAIRNDARRVANFVLILSLLGIRI